MRIFLTLSASASSGFNDLMYRYIFHDTLVALGHEVVFFPYQEAAGAPGSKTSRDKAIVSERILSAFRTHHQKKPFDLFLSYYHAKQVVPELFSQLRLLVPCVNYTTNFHQINLYLPLLKEATLSVFVSKDAEPFFSDNGFTGYYMPFAGLSSHSRWIEKKNGLITFSGTSYGPRAVYLWRCLQQGLPVQIYGANWIRKHAARAALRTLQLERQILTRNPARTNTAYRVMNDLVLAEINATYVEMVHDPLPDEAYNTLLAESSIVLNFPESRHGHDFSNPNVLIGANLRDFEVPVAGSLLLTQENEEIRAFFDPGKEIGTFSNEWEMVDKARYYLDHPSEILRIAAAGHRRALGEHLWEHRFTALLKHIEQNYI